MPYKDVRKRRQNALKYYYSNKPKHTANAYKYILKTKYKLTVEQFSSMHEAQNGICLVCEEQIDNIFTGAKGKKTAVDHCHSIGEVRGLLCKICNTGLGGLKDSPELLRKGAEYLETCIRRGNQRPSEPH